MAADALRLEAALRSSYGDAKSCLVLGMRMGGSWVWGLGCLLGLGFGVWGLGFGVWGLGFGVWGLGFGVWGLGFGGLSCCPFTMAATIVVAVLWVLFCVGSMDGLLFVASMLLFTNSSMLHSFQREFGLTGFLCLLEGEEITDSPVLKQLSK